MNSNENIKVGDRIQKPVIKGYRSGAEEHIETYQVEELINGWAAGVVVDSTDTRNSDIGKKTFILPVDYFTTEHVQEGMLDVTKIKKVA
ncbi:hypothetical protein SEA_LAHQTEMISH_34 [Microbacterium phage Lahqtemish]|uniref:hypothetical protein n=1 Tax=Microbacterium phage Lahqtemish TaxID=2776867 RepID=UPI0018A52D58|nr:hypothetical protein QDW25_gp34 [Microbacterium phage Lahqtemish]QOP66625.1 hypothetical protein SEA_LAHQTEMISH_34 [Microbacterium phage Lahqtemish]